MRFMTFNIKLGLQMGLGPITACIREAAPDVLALQEVGSNWREGPAGDTTARLAQQTGLDHSLFLPTVESSSAVRYGHALLSRWPLRRVATHPLPTRGDEPRAALVADVIGPSEPFRVVATHLSHIDDDRRVQGPELCDLIWELDERKPPEGRERPLVVAGDLNEPRERPDLWLRELLESFDGAGRLDSAPTFENPVPDTCIDYLLIDGRKWSAARVLDRPDLSDHRPVVAET